MKIFYISYWGVKEGLTLSTVIPNLQLLSEDNRVKSIDFFTVERVSDSHFKDDFKSISKVRHHPIFSKNLGFFLFTKIADWLRIRSSISRLAKEVKPDLVICRGAMAGAFGTMLFKKFAIPFIVESFEPHADYMAESGVWKKGGLRYRFQKKTENEIKKHAYRLITVSKNYARFLIANENIENDRVITVPCMVPLQNFEFNLADRLAKRKELNIPDNYQTAVYLGKFAGIYYDSDAFRLFKMAFDFFEGNFFLVILSPTNKNEIYTKLKDTGFPKENVWIGLVQHQEVPKYLSAADFAFNLHKSTKHSFAYSPIKNGEYWASGLPILLPDNIGDDSEIVSSCSAGAIFDINNDNSILHAFSNIATILQDLNSRNEIVQVAKEFRGFEIGKKAYEVVLFEICQHIFKKNIT